MSRRSAELIKFLHEIINDSKDVVDIIIERARDADLAIRSGASTALGDDDGACDPDLARLQASVAELLSKVDSLVTLQNAAVQASRLP
jgi:hypothetical protein